MNAPLPSVPRERGADDGALSDRAPTEPPPRAALLNVQALRALAAFMVVFVHIEALAVMAGAGPRLFEAGNAGVDIFFVISGFIMVFTTGRRPMGALTFMAARLQRIAPLYWLVTLAVFAVALIAPQLLQTTRADPASLAASLLFIPFERSDGALRPVVFVGWTLNYEMAFYVLFSLSLLIRNRTAGVALTVSALTAAVVAGRALHPPSLAGFYTSPIVLEFGLGMLLGLAWPRMVVSRSMAFALAGAGLLAFAAMLAGPTLLPGRDRLLLFGLPAFVIVAAALALERAGVALRWGWVRVLGNASFAIYLSHFFVAQAVLIVARKMGLHGPAAASALALLIFAGVAAVGLALHYGVERPMGAALASRQREREDCKLRLRFAATSSRS